MIQDLKYRVLKEFGGEEFLRKEIGALGFKTGILDNKNSIVTFNFYNKEKKANCVLFLYTDTYEEEYDIVFSLIGWFGKKWTKRIKNVKRKKFLEVFEEETGINIKSII